MNKIEAMRADNRGSVAAEDGSGGVERFPPSGVLSGRVLSAWFEIDVAIERVGPRGHFPTEQPAARAPPKVVRTRRHKPICPLKHCDELLAQDWKELSLKNIVGWASR